MVARLFLTSIWAVTPVLAQATPDQTGPHESGPLAPRPLPCPQDTSAGGCALAGGVISVQANLDALGRNVLGDAANEPSLAVLAGDRIVVGWRQFATIDSDFRESGIAISRDGGRRFSEMDRIDPGTFRTDPVLRADRFGRLFYSSFGITPPPPGVMNDWITISDDGGESFLPSVFTFGGDKQWIAVDDRQAPTIVHQVWNLAGNNFAPAQYARSLDGGLTWDGPFEFIEGSGPHPSIGTCAVGTEGQLVVAGVPGGGARNAIHIVVSHDAGDRTIDRPTFEGTVIDLAPGIVRLGGAPNGSGVLGQVQVVVDRSSGPTRGNIYIIAPVLRVFEPTQQTDIMLLRSTDGGVTWDPPVRVNEFSSERTFSWFGTMSIAPDGRLDIVYNDTRNSPDDPTVSTTRYTFSRDGGRTFEPSVEISPPWNSTIGWPSQSKIGDYYDMASDYLGVHLVYAATFNGEQDIYYARIGPRDCNGNAVDDAQEIADGLVADCNANGVPDWCDIRSGLLRDGDGDGVPDRCVCVADMTSSGDPTHEGYGVPDGVVDVLDLFYFLDRFSEHDLVEADLTGAGNPNDPRYGVPDGRLDSADFVYFLDRYVEGCP